MKKLVEKLLAMTVLLVSVGVGSSAHAVPIVNGNFTLVNDSSSIPYNPGELIATGSFTTANSVTTTLFGFDAVPLTELFVVDRTPDSGLGDISYTASTAANYIVSSPLFALIDQASGDFVGLQGALLNLANIPWLSLSFDAGNANIGGATFAFVNLTTANSESGFQVPEPNVLALFGFGLVGLGVVRRKMVRASL